MASFERRMTKSHFGNFKPRVFFVCIFELLIREREKMSQSQYEVQPELSDDEYDGEEKPRQRLRTGSRNRNYQTAYRQPKPQAEKRQTRAKRSRYQTDSDNIEGTEPRKNYNYAEQYGDDNQEQLPNDEDDQFSIFNIQISQILWRRIRQGTDQFQYLIKYKGRGYLHCNWLTEPQIQAQGRSMKNKINRFNKTFNTRISQGNYDEQAIQEQKYYDQSFLEVDRILTATQMFPVIHQKKANEIKGKWTESLMIVASKLLNFTKNHLHYGVLFCQPVDPQRDSCPDYFKIVAQPMDLGTVLNKLFLDIYKNPQQFWDEIGLVFKNCLKFNKQQTSDLHILGVTLRECAIFLYDQWFHLSQQRYIKLKQELGDTLVSVQATKSSNQNIKMINGVSSGYSAEKLSNLPVQNGQQMKEQNEQQKKQIHVQSQQNEENNEIKLQKMEDENEGNKEQHLKNADNELGQQDQQNQIKQQQNLLKSEEKSKKNDQSQEFQSQGAQQEGKKQLQNQNNENQQQSLSSDESLSKKQSQNKQISEEQRQFLNMQEFFEKNIFLIQKKAQNITTKQELQLFNPGQFSYKWLADNDEDSKKFLSHNYEEIDFQDMKKLDLNLQVDRLYLVKWKNLSYYEATWELQTIIACPEKINQFKMVNKALGREARTAMDSQRQKHKVLVDLQFNPKKKNRFSSPFQLNDLKNKLYFYDVGSKKDPPQYKIQNQPVYKNYKLLRPYQLDSVNWLIKSWYQKRNTILADEMGLGKTIQSIAFLYHLHSVQNVKGPFLVIAPLSTLQHWKRTVEQWTNMNCVLYYDQNGQPGRRSIQYYEWHHTNITMKGNTVPSELNKFQILITSYEVFTLDFNDVIINIPFQFIIVDQAHRLKNKNAKILTTLKRLPCKRVLLLTGTPIQNNTGQLWSLLNYIHPEKFSSFQQFRRNFGDLSSQQQVQRLNKVLKPYMLRRMKQDVEQSIPPLQQTIIDVQMTNVQKTIYRALYQKNKNMLIKGLSSTGSYNTNLNNLQIQLRKCCNHPFLIKEIQHDLLREVYTQNQKVQKLVSASGKMVLVQKLLQKCKRQQKKVLIFSQFTHMLQLIQQYLKFKDFKYQRIDGQIKAKQRQAAIDRYNNPHKKREVFLLSTKAGGVGINLTSANVVIIYDSDWNPQNDVQATARAHRIGQKSEVQVYRLVTCNTYETQMFERATQKLGIDKAIFMSGTFKEAGQVISENKMTKNQMETLLKKGILGFLQSGPDFQEQKAQQFFNKNVDQIIQRNSRVAKYSMINGSCTFSKQRFVSQNSDNQLKINDPNFWNIVLKNVQSHTQQLLKKVKNPQNYRTLEAQKQIMTDASELMGTIIQNKLSLTGFNADDQINLSQFLTIVNSQRQFHKHYRDMASQWLEQVCKPSRRFKKFNIQDLQIPKKGVPVTTIQKKVNTRSKQQDNDNIFGQQEELLQQQEQQSDDKNKLTDAKKQEYLKKLCFLCQKPKCSIYCKSYCKRAFHEQCRKKVEQEGFNNFDDISSKLQIKELCIQNQNLKEMADMSYVCQDCKTNVVQCLICKGKGNYYGAEYKKNKKGKNKNGQQIVQQQIVSKSKKKNQLTKCSTANCAKFFHPKCIEQYDTKKLFKYIDANSMHFRCSLHYCNACGVSGDTMSIYQCVRCPKALHTRCMDKDKIAKVSKKQFICQTHFKNKKDLKKTQDRLQTQTLKKFLKSQKVETKKKQKQKGQQPIEQQQQSQEQDSQNEVLHNYSTRRNKGLSNQESGKDQSPQPILQKVQHSKSEKQDRRGKKKDTGPLITYQQLGIKPITEFDYKSYDQDWCRYCGSRYSSNFTQGPWGSKTLCTVHYIKWKQEKTLKLDGYQQKPVTPIDPTNDQQRKFITTVISKHPEWTYGEVLEHLQAKKNPKRSHPI